MRTKTAAVGALLLAACSSDDGRDAVDAAVPADAAVDADETDGGADALAVAPLVDAEGRAVYWLGVNAVGDAKDPPDFLPGLPDEDYDQLVTWGVTLARVLLFWEAIEPAPGEYDDVYLATIRDELDRLGERGVDVVLDMHQDVFGRGFGSSGAPRWACPEAHYATFVWVDPWFLNYLTPEVTACFDHVWTTPEIRERYREAWRHAADVLGDHPAVIGFDVMNEPYPGSQTRFEQDVLASFYDDVAAALAAAAPGRAIFVEPAVSFNLGVDTDLPPFEVGRVFAPHYYPPFTEGGTYEGDIDDLVAELALHVRAAVRLGAPLVVGEVGIRNHVGDADRYLADAIDAVLSLGGSPVVWALSRGGREGFALLDEDGAPWPIARALPRPYAHRVAGRLVSTSYDRATAELTVTWVETGIEADTVLVLPGEGFADVSVTSDDPPSWTYEHDPATHRVVLRVDHTLARHTFRVAPR
jgi:endoglycosylceramidase